VFRKFGLRRRTLLAAVGLLCAAPNIALVQNLLVHRNRQLSGCAAGATVT
jgi:hypothetical protein